MTIDEWEEQVRGFWTAFEADPSEDVEHVRRLDDLAAVCPVPDGRAAFERACIRDSTGRTEDAVPFYEAGLAAGLDPVREGRTLVQMASSRRVLGQPAAALAIIARADPHALGGAPSIVRALSLHDLGRDAEALRLVIEALVPHLPRYQRSMANYARLLTEPDEPSA
ncbi:MAG: tetratricopeptide repeat protein [Leifsonia sp.]